MTVYLVRHGQSRAQSRRPLPGQLRLAPHRTRRFPGRSGRPQAGRVARCAARCSLAAGVQHTGPCAADRRDHRRHRRSRRRQPGRAAGGGLAGYAAELRRASTRPEVDARWPRSSSAFAAPFGRAWRPGRWPRSTPAPLGLFADHPDRPVTVAVSHASTGRVLRGLYLGLTLEETRYLETPQNAFHRLVDGAVTRIEVDALPSPNLGGRSPAPWPDTPSSRTLSVSWQDLCGLQWVRSAARGLGHARDTAAGTLHPAVPPST